MTIVPLVAGVLFFALVFLALRFRSKKGVFRMTTAGQVVTFVTDSGEFRFDMKAKAFRTPGPPKIDLPLSKIARLRVESEFSSSFFSQPLQYIGIFAVDPGTGMVEDCTVTRTVKIVCATGEIVPFFVIAQYRQTHPGFLLGLVLVLMGVLGLYQDAEKVQENVINHLQTTIRQAGVSVDVDFT